VIFFVYVLIFSYGVTQFKNIITLGIINFKNSIKYKFIIHMFAQKTKKSLLNLLTELATVNSSPV